MNNLRNLRRSFEDMGGNLLWPDVWPLTHLAGLHLQTGRGFIEDVIPPVEAELLSFPVADLKEQAKLLALIPADV